jgi:hypothetical protein
MSTNCAEEKEEVGENNGEVVEVVAVVEEENTPLLSLLRRVRKIVKEAKPNDSLYPELRTIATDRDLYVWINNNYKCFYKVFQTDLLAIMHKLTNEA